MKIISTIFYSLFVILLLAVAGLFLLPVLPLSTNVEIKIVESGSMEPSIMTGALVVVTPASSYAVNDVVTFRSRTADIPTTHRIVDSRIENGQRIYMTKGDANEDIDGDEVSEKAIIGKVLFDVPYAGFVLDFARQPMGFMLLIGLPALLIVIDEIEKIWREIRRRRRGHAVEEASSEIVVAPYTPSSSPPTEQTKMMDINNEVTFRDTRTQQGVRTIPIITRTNASTVRTWLVAPSIVLTFSTLMVGMWSYGSTISYFSDIERALANEFRAGALGFTVTADEDSFSFLGIGGALDDEDEAVIITVDPETESANLKYSLRTLFAGGSQGLCKSIVADSDTPFSYTGNVLALTADDVSFSDPWSLALMLNASTSYAVGDTCLVDFFFTGWNEDLDDEDGGYGDEEQFRLAFTVGEALPPTILGPELFRSTILETLSTTTPEETTPEPENATLPVEDPLPEESIEEEEPALIEEVPETEIEEAPEAPTEPEPVIENEVEPEVEELEVEQTPEPAPSV